MISSKRCWQGEGILAVFPLRASCKTSGNGGCFPGSKEGLRAKEWCFSDCKYPKGTHGFCVAQECGDCSQGQSSIGSRAFQWSWGLKVNWRPWWLLGGWSLWLGLCLASDLSGCLPCQCPSSPDSNITHLPWMVQSCPWVCQGKGRNAGWGPRCSSPRL